MNFSLHPAVTIGMPIYNAERYLRRALDALLGQDFDDFELLISDNGSTDSTEFICLEYAAKDCRIRYVRHAVNRGMQFNFPFVLEQARGEFFMWAAHDDVYAPTFISKCLTRLRQSPDAVACCSEVVFLDEEGSIRKNISYVNFDTHGMSVVDRIFELLKRFNWYATLSLHRREALLKTLPFQDVFGGDVVILVDLLLLGDIVKVYEPLFYYTIPDQDKSIDRYLADGGITDPEQRAKPYSVLLTTLWHHVLGSRLSTDEMAKIFLGFVSIIDSQNPRWRGVILQEHPEWNNASSSPGAFARHLGDMLCGRSHGEEDAPRIVLDGVFFQLNNTGIARLWRSILEEWANEDFGKQVVVLDRGGTLPPMPGIRTRKVPPFRYEAMDLDPYMLEWVCRDEQADIFISTYYTVPVGTPSLFVAYDMIPEVMGMNLREAAWVAKHAAIHHAQGFAAISGSTARDLNKYFPEALLPNIAILPLGVNPLFKPSSPEELDAFRHKYGLQSPFVLMVGFRHGYKNGRLLFEALGQEVNVGMDVVCVGGLPTLEPELAGLVPQVRVHMLQLDDQELVLAYGATMALIYPSVYEGFGLPLLEAMACGCPVIAVRASSIPEVGGDAIQMVSGQDPSEVMEAIAKLRDPVQRTAFVEAGFQRVKHFTWAKAAEALKGAILKQVQPSNPGLKVSQLLDAATQAMTAGQLELAKEHLFTVISLDTHQVAAYLALSDILGHQEAFESVRKVLKAGLNRNPQSELLWEALVVFSASHTPEEACQDARDALSALPEGGKGIWHELVALDLLEKGAAAEAVDLLERGLLAFPDNPQLEEIRRERWPAQFKIARMTVFCAIWHKDPNRWELARGHQSCLDAQTVPVDRVYVLDGGDKPPEWLKGKSLCFKEPLGIYEAWSQAVSEVHTPFVMNLNLDDRLNPGAVELFQKTLQQGADLVCGDWQVCFSQGETDAVGPNLEASAIAFSPEWPPVSGRTVRLGSGTGERGTLGPATAWRMALHQELGSYPSAFADGSPVRVIGDSLWWQRVIDAGRTAQRLPYVIGRYHSHPEEQAEFRNPASEEEMKAVSVGVNRIVLPVRVLSEQE